MVVYLPEDDRRRHIQRGTLSIKRAILEPPRLLGLAPTDIATPMVQVDLTDRPDVERLLAETEFAVYDATWRYQSNVVVRLDASTTYPDSIRFGLEFDRSVPVQKHFCEEAIRAGGILVTDEHIPAAHLRPFALRIPYDDALGISSDDNFVDRTDPWAEPGGRGWHADDTRRYRISATIVGPTMFWGTWFTNTPVGIWRESLSGKREPSTLEDNVQARLDERFTAEEAAIAISILSTDADDEFTNIKVHERGDIELYVTLGEVDAMEPHPREYYNWKSHITFDIEAPGFMLACKATPRDTCPPPAASSSNGSVPDSASASG